ncbi:hypothetical protein [Paracoccus benzoatiresistens]|uniref:DUF805 domain-containing protein n=1 Tax=Paracoccus benzoatiresistens TaxID=2997341 RepID=A0ABT4JBI8_9RHOB|nr:hypothetical protein [Paracoccus sp. EF6]MCZ0964503.1 hypothetical protein [Paracoccus sp. EF6]
MTRLQAFWRGDLPLDEAFWTWTVTIGLTINLLAIIALLTLISLERPWEALVAGYAFTVPYNIMAVIGTWRSAERYPGPTIHADLARGASVALMAVLSVV